MCAKTAYSIDITMMDWSATPLKPRGKNMLDIVYFFSLIFLYLKPIALRKNPLTGLNHLYGAFLSLFKDVDSGLILAGLLFGLKKFEPVAELDALVPLEYI